jgi:hypothetical protein
MTTVERTDFREAESFEEARASLGDMLGLDAPVEAEVARRALVDPKYAMYLMMVRESPALRDKLLNHPGNEDYAAPASPRRSEAPPPQGAAALSAQAVRSMAKWARTGFRKADEEMIARRWAACQACEFLTDPPKSLVYRGLTLIMGSESKICSACGCLARKKAAMPTEACPRADPVNPALTRWGEPLVPAPGSGASA